MVAHSKENFDAHSSHSFVLGNDLWGGQTDEHKTASFSYEFVTDDIPSILEQYLEQNGQNYFSFSMNWEAYTPKDLVSTEVVTDQRPYAGWLYVQMALIETKGALRSAKGFQAGIVGESAKGEEIQHFVHDLTDSKEVNGWDNQLKDEPGVNLFYQSAYRYRWPTRFEDVIQETIVHSGASLGNVSTFIEGGGIYRFGYNIKDDWMMRHRSEHSWGLGSREERKPFAVYWFIRASGRWVIRDIFIEGNTIKDSHGLDKKNWVSIFSTGVVTEWKQFTTGYSYNKLSEQYPGAGSDERGVFFFSYSSLY